MKKIQEETRKCIMKHSEKRETERDRLTTLFDKDGKYEVECVYCGHAMVLLSHGDCQADTEEREYVGDGIFCIRKGNAAPVCYQEVPYLCRGCGQPMKIRLKNDLN